MTDTSGDVASTALTEAANVEYRRMSLARQFLLVSLAIILMATLVTGAWVGQLIESGVLNRTAALAALYVDSFVTPHLQQARIRTQERAT